MSTKEELACIYSALILADDEVPITVSRHGSSVDLTCMWGFRVNMFALFNSYFLTLELFMDSL